MIKPDQIPFEVKLRLRNVLSDGETDEAVALAAAINAWPGAWKSESFFMSEHDLLMLLLPQEKNDG